MQIIIVGKIGCQLVDSNGAVLAETHQIDEVKNLWRVNCGPQAMIKVMSEKEAKRTFFACALEKILTQE